MKLITNIARLVLCLVTLFTPWPMAAQTTFNQLILQPTSNYSDLMGILQVADSTIYGTVDKHTNPTSGNFKNNFAIFSTDKNGNLLWSKDIKPNAIQGINSVLVSHVKELPDGNLALTSASFRNSSQTYGTGIIKITKQGDLIWSKYIEANNPGDFMREYVQLNPNTGGFTVSGTKTKLVNNLNKRISFCV